MPATQKLKATMLFPSPRLSASLKNWAETDVKRTLRRKKPQLVTRSEGVRVVMSPQVKGENVKHFTGLLKPINKEQIQEEVVGEKNEQNKNFDPRATMGLKI